MPEWVIDWVYWYNLTTQPFVAKKSVELKAAEEKIAVLEARLANSQEVRVDSLEKVKGIGSVIKTKHYSDGILSLKQLGNLTSANLEAIVGDNIKRPTDEDEIIQQAEELAEKG